MSYAIDVNLLLYASDESSPRNRRAVEFLNSCASRPEVLCLGWPTITGYLRIATHPSIFSSPLSSEEAIRNMAALMSLPQVRLLSEQDGFWEIYREVAGSVAARGNLVPDAHLATLLQQHGVDTIFTNDTDFRKFGFLKVRNPFD